MPPPENLEKIALTRFGAVWVLRELGFSAVSEAAINNYIQSLKKFNIPLVKEENWEVDLVRYTYEDMMELALALAFRRFSKLADPVLKGMTRHRETLYRIYRQAYDDRNIITKGYFRSNKKHLAEFTLRGNYLDLQITFSGLRLISFGPPRILLPHEVVVRLSDFSYSLNSSIPIPISDLALRIGELSTGAPKFRCPGRTKRTPI